MIVNVTDIAKRLYRKPICKSIFQFFFNVLDVTKYFGCELGAQIYVDEKNDRYIVNGAHDVARLQELLFGFINKFVLCSSCGNPETTLRVKVKAGVVNTTCTACGNRGQLDPRHRLTQFIIKNPPVDEASPTDKKGRKQKKAKNGTENHAEEEEHSPAGDESHNSPSYSDDDDWGEDTTEEAQKKRLEELSSMARKLTINADVEKSESERANIFFKYITVLKQKGEAVSHPYDIKSEAERLNLGVRSVLVVAEVLLSEPKTIIADIKSYKPVFLQFTRIGDHAQKAQGYVLGAMASLFDKYSSENLVAKSCHILKELYDCDIVEEEVILAWFAKNVRINFLIFLSLVGQALRVEGHSCKVNRYLRSNVNMVKGSRY